MDPEDAARSRDEAATDRMMSAVYDELRALAGARFRSRSAVAAQPTSLVHEAWIRMRSAERGGAEWRGREHFLAVAATAMRQILADRARKARREKRGGSWDRVTLSGIGAGGRDDAVDLLVLDDTLSRLEALDPRQARLAVLRIFAGMTTPEIAVELAVSESTVEKEWRRARAWLSAELLGARS